MSGGKYGQLVVISRSGADGKAFPMHTTRVVLKNLSENCTSVNTHVLEAGQQRALKSGDVITIVGRSLRYEENKNSSSETTTPQGSSRAPNVPQTVGITNGSLGGGRPPLVFASGGGPDGQQRQLRRRLSRTPRNPDTARKLKLWDAHYSGAMSVETTSDIFAESPPSGLLDISQRLLAEPDDPFAASSTHEEGAFERMAQSVGRGSEASARRDPGVTAEVAKIMGQISQMAAQNKSPSRMTTPLQSGRKRPRSSTDAADNGSERRRSRSLERVQQQPASAGQRQLYPPLRPQRPGSAVGAAAYGSEDETSRGTVGVSPQSTYNRSPTLQRQRQGGSQSVVVQRLKPIQRAGSTSTRTPELKKTPAQFFSSLPRPINGSSSVVGRRAASSGSPTPVASLSSPLKRTLSSNSNCGARPPVVPLRPILPADDESEEVPTEPEPESESDAEPVVTPENKAGGRPLLLAQESMARKSVRFGPALSPEVFDVGAPPSTPLRRGTPMQMPARASSILRRTSPTRPRPAVVSPSLLRSLLTPRPTRRQAMHQYIASLSALTESLLAVDKPPAAVVGESVASGVPGGDSAADEASAQGASAQGALAAADEAASAQDTLAAADEASAQEALVDIESATVLGASPADRRQRRRRSVRLAASHQQRRATLDSPLRAPLQRASPSSSSPSLLIVKRAVAQSRSYLESPTKRPLSMGAQRRERRRTAPIIGTADFSASMAQMAAALGEDVPTLFAKKMPPEEEREAVDPIIVEDGVVLDVAPLGLADAMQQQQQAEQQVESGATAAAEEASVPSSNVVLLEQAERQARIQGTSPEPSLLAGDFSLGVSSKLAGLSVTTPPPTPITLASPQQGRKHRRQTIADFAPTTEAEEQSVDEILAHRQRLRRIQDRKRRRQTVADLNKRRSSWRGWMPTSNPVDSPPSSPEAHHVADWPTPRVSIKGKEDSSSLVSPTNPLMYPPTAWNTEGESPTKRRRMRGIADIVVSVLGMNTKPANIELANDPKHGTRQPAPAAEPKAFAYPPRPVPIDAGWEKIDVDNAEGRLAKAEEAVAEEVVAEASQQVELYAVSGPASDIDTASLFSAHLPTEQERVVVEEKVLPAVVVEEEAPPAVAVDEPVVTSTVLSPPTTRGRASRSQRQTSESVSPPPPPPPPNITAAMKRTTPRPPPATAASLSTRRRATATTTAAATAPTMTRKRRAEDPAPVAQPIKRGRGRPPANGIRKTPEPSVMSPPATRASKRKSHAT
ncbi:hypothetical protein GGI17_004503 [Coemansia sp. S146]|nr:hypothetical protein GGI17_004503 [Coemansia sp. S146]